jgi:thiol-disulfide isomerase/thioredoxin
MKKITAILLILATLCLFLVSCNGNNDTDTSEIIDTSSDILTNTDSNTVSDADVDKDTSADTNTDTNTDTDIDVDTSTDTEADTSTDTSVDTDTDADDTEKVYAPNIKLLDYNGNEVTLESFRGKVIVLNFWASWCPPCKAEMPDFEKAFQKYGSDVEFVMVSHLAWGSDTIESAKSFYNQSGYTFPIYFDYQFEGYYAYGLESIPRTVIINSDFTVSAYYTGMISEQILENAIENAK